MRRFLMVIGVALMAALPLRAFAGDDGATLYAVTFHADWCGSCKTLNPKMTEARADAGLDTQNVLFVTLDLTDDTTKSQAALMARTLGLDTFYTENKGKTGFVLLVNSATGMTVGRLTKSLSPAEIATEIQAQIAAL